MKFNPSVLLTLLLCFAASSSWAGEAEEVTETLYQRLGGEAGVRTIVQGTLERHLANPTVVSYFQHIDQAWLEDSVVAFFSAGTGGPNDYQGQDMVTAHAHLRITDAEFDAAVADVLASVTASGANQAAHDEVQTILLSFRPQIVAQ
jgi:hemoglobin